LLSISNTALVFGNLADLTDLTLLNIAFAGPNAGLFSVPDFLDDTVVSHGGAFFLDINFLAPTDGGFVGTMTIDTDRFASIGDLGQSFTFAVEGAAIPAPAGMAVFLLAPIWLQRRVGWRGLTRHRLFRLNRRGIAEFSPCSGLPPLLRTGVTPLAA
jgi:hypothetical protein